MSIHSRCLSWDSIMVYIVVGRGGENCSEKCTYDILGSRAKTFTVPLAGLKKIIELSSWFPP